MAIRAALTIQTVVSAIDTRIFEKKYFVDKRVGAGYAVLLRTL